MLALLEYPLRTDRPRYDDEDVLVATVECVRCGQEVRLTGTPCEWTERDDGSVVVTDVGPGIGHCCGLLYADGLDGVEVYEIPERTCRVCGCSELDACPGGCAWVGEDLCSRCA